MKLLITGTAGFIGYHLVKRMLPYADEIIGLDSINDYYDIDLKYARLEDTGIKKKDIEVHKKVQSTLYKHYSFIQADIADKDFILELFEREKFDYVCNLAAQAGMPYSITHPYAYLHSNMAGFLNIIEGCRHNTVKHLVYASSSSVYGLNKKMPFSVSDNVDHPVSLYAASKKTNELMAHTYSHLYRLPTTGLRFFTVYGQWGRPDMSLYIFTKAIIEGKPIDVYNGGKMARDFTYIDDITESIKRIVFNIPQGDPAWQGLTPDPAVSEAPYRLYNIGNNNPVQLIDFIRIIENNIGKKAIMNFLPMRQGDVAETWADTSHLVKDICFQPSTSLERGVSACITWYKEHYSK